MTDNTDIKGRLIWADDEIDLLKPHIIYLEKRGYSVEPVNSGEDALHRIRETDYDLVLLDEMMGGLDGLTTLKMIKEIKPNIPVVMVTKNEEEWLMDEAIGEQIANFLTKPVNPSQILLTCKNILETNQIQSDKVTREYLQEFQNISLEIEDIGTIGDWVQVYEKLTDWSVRFDTHGDENLRQVLADQQEEANTKFIQYYLEQYPRWLNESDRPALSPDIVPRFVIPNLKSGEKVVFLVLDCMRVDHWQVLRKLFYPYFNIETRYALSILPTATPFSRNSIFSGHFPSEIKDRFPSFWAGMVQDESSMNRYEDQLFRKQLDNAGCSDLTSRYFKILTYDDGIKLTSHIPEYQGTDVLAIVVNFIDMLGHTRSESDTVQEMVPDEAAYRDAVKSWAENAWLLNLMKEISTWNHRIVVTSDHGSIRVNKPVRVKADRSASTGVRYKFGRNLQTDNRASLIINDPLSYMLPQDEGSTNYLIAKGRHFYVYPNEYHRFVNKFSNSFQHGGISLDEVVLPVGIMQGRQV